MAKTTAKTTAYTKPKPTANQTAARRSGKTSWQRPGGPTPTYDAQFRQDLGMGTPNYVPGSYNQNAYSGYANAIATGGLPPIGPGNPISTGPGGGGSGGGGGGGGGSVLTQAMFDQMVAALGRQGQQQTYTPLNLPAFQGQNIAAFNATPYTQAQDSLNQAVAADTANVNTNAQNTTTALTNNYTNDYANATVTPGATQAPVGVGLTGGGGGAQQAANDVNAANGDSQAAFRNLLTVLGAAANQSQTSRLGQVAMDRTSALNQIGAQNLGLGAGINQARAQGQNQWSQQDNERRYQNSLMSQQWQREQAMQNNQGLNTVNQANVQQRNQQMQTILQPLLDLIASTGGQRIDTSALTALLARQ
jgi:hypothetical protein